MTARAQIGRGVRVEVGKTEGTAKMVSAVTAADPGVATSTAHSLTDGSAGYFASVVGMDPLDGQAVRVAEADTNSFELEAIDTSDWPAFVSGQFIPVTAWATVAEVSEYQLGGGESTQLDDGVLLDEIAQQAAGLPSAQTITFPVKPRGTPSEGMALVRAKGLKGADLLFRVTFKDGTQDIFRGTPSLPNKTVGLGALASGQFTVSVRGMVLDALPALA